MSLQNFDPSEIQKFSAMAHQWWDLQGPCAPLHHLNPLRMRWIQSHLSAPFAHDTKQSYPLENLKILDIGCGGGILSEALAALGAEVLALDQSEQALEVANTHQALRTDPFLFPIDYQHLAVEHLAENSIYHASFDAICCMEMLEHVPNPSSILQAASPLLKPGGQAFFSTLNRTVKSYLFGILGAEYVLKLLPKGTHQWQAFLRPSELSQLIREAGLIPQKIQGVSYCPWRQEANYAQDVSINYMLSAWKPQPS